MSICIQCERRPIRIKYRQLCKTCSNYEDKQGKPRPPTLDNKHDIEDGELCKTCERREIRVKKYRECSTCYSFRESNGFDRPKSYDEPRPILICSVCSAEAEKLKVTRCQSCYSFWNKHKKKKDRPYWLWTPPENRPCRNPYCTVKDMSDEKPQRGFCNACFMFWKRTGNMRYKDRYNIVPCKNCGSTNNRKLVDGRCKACDFWLRDHQEERPQRIYQYYRNNPMWCKNPNCGNPIPDHERWRGGYCNPCFCYRRNNRGAKRPVELCKMDFPKTRCSCGEEATHKINVKMMTEGRTRNNNKVYYETYEVCDECYQIEIQIQKGLI